MFTYGARGGAGTLVLDFPTSGTMSHKLGAY